MIFCILSARAAVSVSIYSYLLSRTNQNKGRIHELLLSNFVCINFCTVGINQLNLKCQYVLTKSVISHYFCFLT